LLAVGDIDLERGLAEGAFAEGDGDAGRGAGEVESALRELGGGGAGAVLGDGDLAFLFGPAGAGDLDGVGAGGEFCKIGGSGAFHGCGPFFERDDFGLNLGDLFFESGVFVGAEAFLDVAGLGGG